MRLRKLHPKDAPLMLEWMHDPTVVENLRTNFTSKTMEDCKAFIQTAQDMSENIHLAIIDESDTYMGTVSLKHIKDGKAEFAITIRKSAMGLGYSKFGMNEMIRIGIEDLKLNMIYWCVTPENIRAVRFYDKNGYDRVASHKLPRVRQFYSKDQVEHYIWYMVEK